jgi:hypothetical protein
MNEPTVVGVYFGGVDPLVSVFGDPPVSVKSDPPSGGGFKRAILQN